MNILLHVWATLLVLQLVLALGCSRFMALVASLLFGVHGIHSEVVAGVVGRAELFAFVFGLQGVLLMEKALRSRKPLIYVASGALFFLAYCSKEIALAWLPFVPCLFLARTWLQDPERSLKAVFAAQGWRWLVVGGVPVVLFFVGRQFAMSLHAQHTSQGDYSQNPLLYVDFAERLMTAIKIWGYGFWRCVWPDSLCCLYPRTRSPSSGRRRTRRSWEPALPWRRSWCRH